MILKHPLLSVLTMTALTLGYQGTAQASEYSTIPPNTSAESNLLMQPVIYRYQSVSALDMAKQNPELSTLVEAVHASGISRMLAFAGKDYTIFAPSNAAFESLFRETRLTKQSLMANKPLLRMLLGYHVIKDTKPLSMQQLPAGTVRTLNKKPLAITQQRSILDERGRLAHITQPNITTRNGMVHVVDRVLFPAQ